MGNNSILKFIFLLSRFPAYRGSVLGRLYCTNCQNKPYPSLPSFKTAYIGAFVWTACKNHWSRGENPRFTIPASENLRCSNYGHSSDMLRRRWDDTECHLHVCRATHFARTNTSEWCHKVSEFTDTWITAITWFLFSCQPRLINTTGLIKYSRVTTRHLQLWYLPTILPLISCITALDGLY